MTPLVFASLVAAAEPTAAIAKVEGAETCGGLPIQGGWVVTPITCLPWDVVLPKVRVDGAAVETIARAQGVLLAVAKPEGADPAAGWALDRLYTGSMAPWFDKEIRCEGFDAKGRVSVRGKVVMEAVGLVGLQGVKVRGRFGGVCFIDDETGAHPLGTAAGDAKGIAVRRLGPYDAWLASIVDPDGGHEAPAATAPVEGDPLRGYMVAAKSWSYLVVQTDGKNMSSTSTVETWTPIGTDERGNSRYSVVVTEDGGYGPKDRPAQEYTLGPDGMRLLADEPIQILPPSPKAGATWSMGPYACRLEADAAACAEGLVSICTDVDYVVESRWCPGQGWRGQHETAWKNGKLQQSTCTSTVRRDGRAAWPDEPCGEPTAPR